MGGVEGHPAANSATPPHAPSIVRGPSNIQSRSRVTLHGCRVRVGGVEGHPCGQFSYPTLQYAPDTAQVFVAYTVLFLPSSMPPDCKVCYV